MEYLPLAKTLALGQPYALGTLFFALVYHAISKYVFEEPYHRVGGALWLFSYFLELSYKEPSSLKTFGLHVYVLCMPSDDLISFFLGLVDRALVYLLLKPDSIHI